MGSRTSVRASTTDRVSGLTYEERHLLGVCVDRYIADMRDACAEDQDDPEGKPGTVGRELQDRLRDLKARLR